MLIDSVNLLKKMFQAIDCYHRQSWEQFNLKFYPASFLQSWSAGEMHARLGKKIIRRGYLVNGKLEAVALLIREEAKRGRHLICPGGPVVNWDHHRLAVRVLADLSQLGNREKAVFVRVRPPALDQPRLRQVFKEAGFRPAPMHLAAETTWELDLQRPLSELLQGMRKGTRQAIKKTKAAGVRVEKSLDPTDADRLYQLQLATVQRQQFVPFAKKYFRAHAEAFLPANLVFFKAFWQDKLWAMALVVYYGRTAVYHYAASKTSPKGISPPSLILWEAIIEAQARNCQTFNFWGVAPTDTPKHRFAGVTRFKQGFGGQRVFYLHAQDKPLRLSYWPVFAFETLRRVWRRL